MERNREAERATKKSPTLRPGEPNRPSDYLYSVARNYRMSADILHRQSDTGVPALASIYFLLGFSYELYLKSLLCHFGYAERQLMAVGHDLQHALAKAETFITIPDFDGLRHQIGLLGPLHKKHAFRYLKKGVMAAPEIAPTLKSLHDLDRFVRQILGIPEYLPPLPPEFLPKTIFD